MLASTSRSQRSSCAALARNSGSRVAVSPRDWLTIHAWGWIPARSRSCSRAAASWTGVASGRVTMSTRLNSGSRRRGSN